MVTKYYRAGYEAVRKHSKTAYVIMSNRLGLGSDDAFSTETGLERAGIAGPIGCL